MKKTNSHNVVGVRFYMVFVRFINCYVRIPILKLFFSPWITKGKIEFSCLFQHAFLM